MSLTSSCTYAAFTCYRNYCKYELLSRKLDMNGLREAYDGQFLTMKLVFMIIPIARECSITHTKTVKTCLLISKTGICYHVNLINLNNTL